MMTTLAPGNKGSGLIEDLPPDGRVRILRVQHAGGGETELEPRTVPPDLMRGLLPDAEYQT